MKTVIEIEKLGYSYGEGWILNDLSLKIEQGDFVAVIGPNGAGKSTLLRLLAGILKPAQGRIAIFGQDRENFTAWDKIGYVPQNPARQHRAFPISVREVVSLGRLSGGSMFQHYTHEDKAAVDDIIERFSLKKLAHRKIGELSGGQQQRVYLARAMVRSPQLLLLDEPATGVDPDAKEELYTMLGEINRGQGVTIVMVSHDLELAVKVCKYALCLDHYFCGIYAKGVDSRADCSRYLPADRQLSGAAPPVDDWRRAGAYCLCRRGGRRAFRGAAGGKRGTGNRCGRACYRKSAQQA